MGVLNKIKGIFTGPQVIIWECNNCGETFETSMDETSQPPSQITCQICGVTDIQEVTRKSTDA